MRGRVKFFLKDKGYGFIKYLNDDGFESEIFVHGADVSLDLLAEPGDPILKLGDFVEFEIGETPKGKTCAKNVLLLN